MRVMITAILVGIFSANAVFLTAILVRIDGLIRRFQFTPEEIDNKLLPTVSVCIPARNETHAMTECLERVLASDYEKIEIIVLDDSSVDDTSVLIKSFAHAGVRFVEGSPLPDEWLGKNNALEGLLRESSSKYVLFLGVDAILQPHSIRRLVSWAVARDQSFVSVLPQRADGLRASVFMGTLRYFWTLLLDSKSTPAVSGISWLADRRQLIESGGFTAHKLTTRPEVRVARTLVQRTKQYMLLSNSSLGVSYEKKWQSQLETSVRLLKPVFKGSLRTLVVAAVLVWVTLVPFILLVMSAVTGYVLGLIVAIINVVLLTLISLRYFKAVWRYGWLLGALHWPLIVFQEAILMVASVIKYARGTVTWKGRLITNSVKK